MTTQPVTPLERLAFVKHKAPLDWTPEECRTIDKAAPVLLNIAEAAQAALNELGVPDDNYPALVANAVEILRGALAALDAADSGGGAR